MVNARDVAVTSCTRKITTLLAELGLGSGDVVFVHSGTGALGRLCDRPSSPQAEVNALHEGLRAAIGPAGTVAAPAFYYDYARHGRTFVVEKSPPDASLGLYPRFLFNQPGVRRSLNPITSIQALGPQAEVICPHLSAYGYGHASPWARLLDLNAWCLFLGAPLQAMTFVHHVEAMVGVPHLYNKLHRPPIEAGGRRIELPAVTAVRYLDFAITYRLARLEAELHRRGMLRTLDHWGGNAQLVRLRDVEQVLVEALARDPYFLLERPPAFVPGRQPDDGVTGPTPAKRP